MDIKHQTFYTLEHLNQLIELSIYQVLSCVKSMELQEGEVYLREYTEFKGLLKSSKDGHSKAFYVDGIFQVHNTQMCHNGDLDDLTTEVVCLLTEVKGTKYYTNKNIQIGDIYETVTTAEAGVIKYSYDEFISLIKLLGIPLLSLESPKKVNFNYDPQLINHLSNFTVEQASRIAANAPLKDQQGVFYSTSLVKHYQEIISECVKGQNQHSFHLFTMELWVQSHVDYEPCSRRYDNGTRLVVGADIDIELTVISKSEFLRWCKYMDIETGLHYNPVAIDESIEALKIQLNESENEISRLQELYLNDSQNELTTDVIYPSELQLAIDAYKQLCLDQEKQPTNEKIKEWLKTESKSRGITHKDGATTLMGLSDKKLTTIPSIIKSIKL